jgi:hypothetical protein
MPRWEEPDSAALQSSEQIPCRTPAMAQGPRRPGIVYSPCHAPTFEIARICGTERIPLLECFQWMGSGLRIVEYDLLMMGILVALLSMVAA